jgi:hypothetical protein
MQIKKKTKHIYIYIYSLLFIGGPAGGCYRYASEIQMALIFALCMVICGGFQKCFKYRQKCVAAERQCSRWK